MTTICAKDGIIASDTRMTGGSYMTEGLKKVFQVGDEWIGLAGEVCKFPEFIDWYRGDTDEKPNIEDMEVLVMHKNGDLSIFEGKCVAIPVGKCGAIGSGAQFAMGAMYAGKTAKESIKIAAQLDQNTGKRVKTYTNK